MVAHAAMEMLTHSCCSRSAIVGRPKTPMKRLLFLLAAAGLLCKAQIVILDHDTGQPISNPLQLPDVPVNDFEQKLIDIRNTGTSTVTVSPLWAFGLDLSLCCGTGISLSAGQTSSITLSFAPQTVGNYSGSIQIGETTILVFARSLAAASLFVQTPSGLLQAHTATPLQIPIDGDFPGQLPCILQNNSGSPVKIQSIAAAGDWTIEPPSLPVTLSPGGSLSFSLAGNSGASELRGSITVNGLSYEVDVDADLPSIQIEAQPSLLASGEQAAISISFSHAPAIALEGSLDVSLETAFDVAVQDPAVLFPSTGGDTAGFASTPGQLLAAFEGQTSVQLQTGTTAGVLRLHAKWGFSESTASLAIVSAPISIETISAKRGSSSLDIGVTGFDNT